MISSSVATNYNGAFGGPFHFTPSDAVANPNGDIDLFFVSRRRIQYSNYVYDPWLWDFCQQFQSAPECFVRVLGCVEFHQFCNAPQGSCTPFSGFRNATAAIGTLPRKANALSASNLVKFNNLIQFSVAIPSDQWIRELTAWNNASMAMLQEMIMEGITGPNNASAIETMQNYTRDYRPLTPEEKDICNNLKIRSSSHVSFSITGLVILFATGGMIMIANSCRDIIDRCLRGHYRRPHSRRLQWISDGNLQLQRMAQEGQGVGPWTQTLGEVPVTSQARLLGVPAIIQEEADMVLRLTAPDIDTSAKWEGTSSQRK